MRDTLVRARRVRSVDGASRRCNAARQAHGVHRLGAFCVRLRVPLPAQDSAGCRTSSRGFAMTAIKQILCPVDFSEFSRHALDSAVAIARQQHAALTALYVVPPPQTAYPPIGLAAYVPYVYTAADLQEFQKTLERFVAAADYPVPAVSVERWWSTKSSNV